MKKLYQVLAIALFSFIPLLSSASPVNSNSRIILTGGKIGPNQDIEISFSKLLESVIYEVRCPTIASDAKSGQDSDYIALYSIEHNLQPAINGNPLHATWQGEIATRQFNELSLKNVTTASGSVIIRNLDDTDTIRVMNCYAFPQV